MTKNSEEIMEDLKAYFKDYEVNEGRWDVIEVSMKIKRESGDIHVLTILKPRRQYQSLSDLR